jgi:hypothetical protein
LIYLCFSKIVHLSSSKLRLNSKAITGTVEDNAEKKLVEEKVAKEEKLAKEKMLSDPNKWWKSF